LVEISFNIKPINHNIMYKIGTIDLKTGIGTPGSGPLPNILAVYTMLDETSRGVEYHPFITA